MEKDPGASCNITLELMMINRIKMISWYALAASIVLASNFFSAHAAGEWTVRGEEDFSKGRLDGVSVLSTGELVLAPEAVSIGGLEANFVWDIASCQQGITYIAAGAPGSVYRLGNDYAELLHETEEQHVLSVLTMKDGSVLIGTAPEGIVYRLEKENGAEIFADLDANYIWDMVRGEDNSIYCATGPDGRLFRINEEGESSVLFQAPQMNLLTAATDQSGRYIYAGTQPDGLVYQIDRDGNYSILFDAEEDEIRNIISADSGELYASTAQTEQSPRRPAQNASPEGASRIEPPRRNNEEEMLPGKVRATNSIYRLEPEKGAYKIAEFPEALILSLACWQDCEEVLAGTGAEGRLVGVRTDGRTRVLLESDARHITALSKKPEGDIVMGTSNPGQLMRIERGYRKKGVYKSEVFDAEYLARWGALHSIEKKTEDTACEIFLRTGNSGEPDTTWSQWSEPVSGDGAAAPDVPMGRFAQVRIELSTESPDKTPELIQFAVHYRQTNRRPVIEQLDVTDGQGAGGGGPGSSTLRIEWDVSDPNEDELECSLFYRGTDEKNWRALKTGMREEAAYGWDTARVPDGYYLIKLIASDEPSRGAAEALESSKVHGPLLVDNTAPEVHSIEYSEREIAHHFVITGEVSDRSSRIQKIKVSHNSGEWQPVFTDDGLFDSKQERFTFPTGELEKGEHVFVFAARDAAGNWGSAQIIIEVEN